MDFFYSAADSNAVKLHKTFGSVSKCRYNIHAQNQRYDLYILVKKKRSCILILTICFIKNILYYPQQHCDNGRYRKRYFSNTERYRQKSDRPISDGMHFFQYRSKSTCIGPADIGIHRIGLYRHASDRPMLACIGLTYIGMYRSKSRSTTVLMHK